MTLCDASEFPAVSVLVPLTSRAEFLPWVIWQYCRQSWPVAKRELIVLDGGAEDRAAMVSALLQGEASAASVRYLHRPQALSEAGKRNLLAAEAQGDVLLFLSDNLSVPADFVQHWMTQTFSAAATSAVISGVPLWYASLNRLACLPGQISASAFSLKRSAVSGPVFPDSWQPGSPLPVTRACQCLPAHPQLTNIIWDPQRLDADLMAPGSQFIDETLKQRVPDAISLQWYQSLHQGAKRREAGWSSIAKIAVVVADDEAQALCDDLGLSLEQLSVIPTQLPLTEQWLLALRRATEEGWPEFLFLPQGTRPIGQAKYSAQLEKVFAAFKGCDIPLWLLSGQITEGREIKALPGVVQVQQAGQTGAVLVRASYYSVLADALLAREDASVAQVFTHLAAQGQWLGCTPSLFDNGVADYFTAPGSSGSAVGFYMETAFHYQVYKPILAALRRQGVACELVISDEISAELVKEMLTLLQQLSDPALRWRPLSQVRKQNIRYACLLSPYFTPLIQGLSEINIRTLYGLAKEQWNHAWWNAFYHRILCYSHYTQHALDVNGSAIAVGNPRFDAWHTGDFSSQAVVKLKLDPAKKTLLYAPTFGELSSLPHWAKIIGRLEQDFNVVTKLHHGTLCRPEEKDSLALARRHLRHRMTSHDSTLALLHAADYVLTDNSGFIFDAIHAGKKTVLLSWENMEALLEGERTFSSASSPDQKIRTLLPVVEDIVGLRQWLSEEKEAEWQTKMSELESVRHHYCDAWQDGQAAERAARVIINAIENPQPAEENAFLHSLRSALFRRA
ncbi:glycosyltransferase [Enterobacteriaceae bacterium C23F]